MARVPLPFVKKLHLIASGCGSKRRPRTTRDREHSSRLIFTRLALTALVEAVVAEEAGDLAAGDPAVAGEEAGETKVLISPPV